MPKEAKLLHNLSPHVVPAPDCSSPSQSPVTGDDSPGSREQDASAPSSASKTTNATTQSWLYQDGPSAKNAARSDSPELPRYRSDSSPTRSDSSPSPSKLHSGSTESSLASLAQEPISFSHLLMMFFAVAIPNAAAIVVFSAIGMGLEVYNTVSKREMSLYGDALLLGSCFLAGFFLVLDWWYWPKLFKVITSIVPIFIFYAGSVLKGRRYPWAAMLLTLFLMPSGLGAIRMRYCRMVKLQQFYGAVSAMTFCAAVVVAVMWGWYIVMDDHGWAQSTQDALAAESKEVYANVYPGRPLIYVQDCGPNKNTTYLNSLDKTTRADILLGCDEAGTMSFLCWMCPFAVLGIDLVVAAFCMFTGVLGSSEPSVRSIQRKLTRFMLMLAFILSGLFACITVSATSVRLGSTLMAFFFTALGFTVVWLLTEVELDALKDTAKSSKLMQQLIAIMHSDWTKAMIVGALGFPMIVFFCLNYLCQRCRKCRGVPGIRAQDKFTPQAMQVVDVCQKWNWTSIFIKIILLGELFFVLQVGVAKVTYVFLSWMNTRLENTPLGIVVVLVYLIGGSMFLLPPVPGLPVYVFAGILLGEKGRQEESVGFWLGCLIAMALGLFTKLCACVGQYMIGFYLGKSVKVQQLIGVDKVPTRAIEHMLKSRGLNPGKVALLVGGPDWPTSVTCGIVGVNIPQMLLGTLPVVVLLAPCILAGACMGRVSPGQDSDWSMLANTFTATAAVVNMASMAYAVYTISDTVAKHGDELAKARPEHEVVAALTRQEAASVACYDRVTAWKPLSAFWKISLVTSAICAVLPNMIFVVFAEQCFRSFAVSSKINDPYEKDGLRRNAFNMIIMPYGGISLGIFFVGVCLHMLFIRIMGRRSRWAYLNKVGAIGTESSTTGAPP